MTIKPLTHLDDLRELAIYIFKKSACCTRLTKPQRSLVDFILPCVHLFRNISLVSDPYPKSHIQHCISFPRLTYINREDLGYTPHRSTSIPSESTHFRISHPHTVSVEDDHREDGSMARYRASVDNQQLRGDNMAGYLHNGWNRPRDRWL